MCTAIAAGPRPRRPLSCIGVCVPVLSTRLNRWRFALSGLSIGILLSWATIGFAAGSTITLISFEGTNTDLVMTISGSGFGTPPNGVTVPCQSCGTPYIHIGRSCSSFYTIAAWTQNRIILGNLQGNPGDSLLVSVENPQNKSIGLLGTVIPESITFASPKITSVTFRGSGASLKMTVTGSGFGNTPASLPGEQDLPFFSFIDLPFGPRTWQAGYGSPDFADDAVTLNYLSWSDQKIVISGFGGDYGNGPSKNRKYTVASKDRVAIQVANAQSCGLGIAFVPFSYVVPNTPGFYPSFPTAAVWGGYLP
jgi:hypothetical protein